MKKFQLYLTVIACGLFLTLNSCDSDQLSISPDEVNGVQIEKPEVSAKGSKLSSVNGQGGLVINDRHANFAFHASIDLDGNVKGSWQSLSPGQDIGTHGTIDCIIFIDDNTAILTGTITKVKKNDGEWPRAEVGNLIWFKVVDNGEGKKAATDQFSDYYITDAGCTNFDVNLYDISNGNIQVKK
jgi:hypothetical protein